MKKKLGPLELWQWAAIGAAAGVLVLLYMRRSGSAQAASVGATPADAQYDPSLGAIDPTTGLPYASGASGGVGDLSGGIGQNATPMSLADELNDFGMIVGLLSDLQGTVPAPATNTGAASTTDQPAQATGTQPASAAEPAPGFHKGHSKGHEYYLPGTGWVSQARFLAATVRGKVTKPKTNPGHIVTTRGGKSTARSTAPHTNGQHKHVAPPSHQRHEPTRHPSKPKAHIEHGAQRVAVSPPRKRAAAKKKPSKRRKVRR